MQVNFFGRAVFISQAPVDECLRQISRIFCLAPQGGAVSPRRIATPILPRVRILTGHLSIRPDSPCHQLMEHSFGLPEGSILPGFKNLYVCAIGRPKQFCAQILRKLSGIYGPLRAPNGGGRGRYTTSRADYRNIRARKLHRQRQSNIAKSNNSYFHYLVSLLEAAAFCTGWRFRRMEEAIRI